MSDINSIKNMEWQNYDGFPKILHFGVWSKSFSGGLGITVDMDNPGVEYKEIVDSFLKFVESVQNCKSYQKVVELSGRKI